jgi:SAM-dependent methyltransferase
MTSIARIIQRLRPARPTPAQVLPSTAVPIASAPDELAPIEQAMVDEAPVKPEASGPIYTESRRDRMLKGLDLAATIGAEIGPLHNPLVLKTDGPVLYLDHCDTETLRAIWSRDPTVDVSRLHVDAVWRGQTLVEALNEQAPRHSPPSRWAHALDYVVASHVVEHVPDLIGWLAQIRAALKPGGQLRLAVPDRRFTFDYLRQDTTLADVLAAHLAGARVPSAACILDHTLNMVQVDVGAAWRGDVDVAALKPVYPFDYCVATARDALANGTYHDFHCWVFTPASFLQLLLSMAEHSLHDFACSAFYDTPQNDFEFIVHLQPCADPVERTQSWRRALPLARQYGMGRA